MAVTRHRAAAPHLSRLAAACRAVWQAHRLQPGLTLVSVPAPARPKAAPRSNILQAFCLSALALPGMDAAADPGSTLNPALPSLSITTAAPPADAGDTEAGPPADNDDEVGYQYSHYEEGVRKFVDLPAFYDNGVNSITPPIVKYPLHYQPITVDSEHGFTRFRPTDRSRFAFNYLQDVWSGATPWFTAPAATIYNPSPKSSGVGASYGYGQALSNLVFNAQGQPMYRPVWNDANLDKFTLAALPLQHVLGYASPEMRNQADFKLGYDWDNAALDIGGGASIERDYLSRFGNLGLRLDFNQKLTTLNLGASYTNSDTHAILSPVASPEVLNHSLAQVSSGYMGEPVITGNRQDGALSLALSQVLSKNAVLSSGLSYTNTSGYLGNPYKDVAIFVIDPNWWKDANDMANKRYATNPYPGISMPTGIGLVLEQRPGLRNQFNWDTSYRHYIQTLDAVPKLSYTFFHDDWGINAHTFDAEWRQALLSSWTLTPHVRYYSQSAASFYTPYLLENLLPNGTNLSIPNASGVPAYFSSDQRLSAYGTISGGFTLSKQFARGLTMELGYEYYAHAGSLKLGGGGTADYADYHYFVANAGLRANLGELAKVSSSYDSYGLGDWFAGLFDSADRPADPHTGHRHDRAAAPAGVMFTHMLDHAGEFMLGYRYLRNPQGSNYQHGTQTVGLKTLLNQGCPLTNASKISSNNCVMYNTGMTMNMHMLDLMYAPSDWLTLMLMPQFMSMDMDMRMDPYLTMQQMMLYTGNGMYPGSMRDYQNSGGFGDTGAYALFRLWDGGGQHLHITHGISAPTGSVDIKAQFISDGFYGYDMQLGSGTWDYKPSLTYTGQAGDWFWGGQVSGTHRLQQLNSYGYRLGDIFQSTVWSGYQFTDWLSTTLRGIYTGQGKMVGAHSLAMLPGEMVYMPDQSPANSGGSFADLGLGFTVTIPHGRWAGNSLSFEWLQPMYTNYQGYQLERSGALAANWSYAF
ncbi:DUF3570 domain-containing protein [Methylomonas paludis]|uniref:DUF3570 domain-containing protein n=1 Tax=Methylomonas paludis TaxID=1173101 RepID=A0A975MKN4_9GAMM|nr:DUF3570 domain-containing protein [Methylomonas paludis]QWF69547.1 DUF3570 domain-containing protein [Methylomonas paludis]